MRTIRTGRRARAPASRRSTTRRSSSPTSATPSEVARPLRIFTTARFPTSPSTGPRSPPTSTRASPRSCSSATAVATPSSTRSAAPPAGTTAGARGGRRSARLPPGSPTGDRGGGHRLDHREGEHAIPQGDRTVCARRRRAPRRESGRAVAAGADPAQGRRRPTGRLTRSAPRHAGSAGLRTARRHHRAARSHPGS